MNEDLSLEEAWESYRKMVMPAKCSEAQLKETRRAFYAGAMAALASLQKSEGESLGSLRNELAQFLLKIGLGEY